jgi:hypothetical protein
MASEDKRAFSRSGEFPGLFRTAQRSRPDKSGFFFQTQNSYGFQDSKSTYCIGISGVFRGFKRYLNMALGSQIVDFIRLNLLNDPNQVGCIGKIAVVQNKPLFRMMWVLIEMIHSVCVEKRSPALDAVDNITFF